MERDFAGSKIGKAEFRQLADICRNDPKFPASFEDWQRVVDEGERQLAAEQKSVPLFDIHPPTFEAWCLRVGIVAGFDALRAYLIVNRRAAIAAASEAGQGASPSSSGKSGDEGTADFRALVLALLAFPAIHIELAQGG